MMANVRGKFIFIVIGFFGGCCLCLSWIQFFGMEKVLLASDILALDVATLQLGGSRDGLASGDSLLNIEGPSAPKDLIDEEHNPVVISSFHRVSNDGHFFREADFAKDDEDWEKKSCPRKELFDVKKFYDYIETPRVQCGMPIMVGGYLSREDTIPIVDGGKWICMNKNFNVRPMDCRVLSFGINTDWSFDDIMDVKYACKVYCFDPTIGKPDHNRSSNIQFFNLGISDKNNTGAGVKKKVDRYVNIIKKLKLENSTIDYLKMDVEGYERNFLQDVLTNTPNTLKNVKMIGIEIHLPSPGISGTHKQYWKQFQMLECLGFKILFSEKNQARAYWFKWGKKIHSVFYELVWARDRQW